MLTGYPIYYLRNYEIDRLLWDACIEKSENGLIYFRSYYLDGLTENWDAIVLKDYEAVMPLPRKQKYLFTYVYPPPFIQQLGICSAGSLHSDVVSKMIQLAEQHFKFGEYFFNFQNVIQNTVAKQNFILPLNRAYETIFKNYKPDLKNNLKKSSRFELHYLPTEDYKKAVRLYQATYAKRMPHVKEEDYNRLAATCQTLNKKNNLLVREVKDKAGNIMAIALCLKDKKRIYLLLSTITPAGRKSVANHFVIDRLIQEFAGEDIILDFEGSDLPGIAHFYKNFGSINQPYFFYRWNKLPWPLNKLKDR